MVNTAERLLALPETVSSLHVAPIPGSGDVGTDGSASYRIPLWVPPGRQGMQPSLALSYNSQRGNDVAGVGWSLGGLPAVHRCRRAAAFDDEVHPIAFDGDDLLCLAGNRLVLLEGTYGRSGAVYYLVDGRRERIVQHGDLTASGVWFEHRDAKGHIQEFGRTAEARLSGTRHYSENGEDTYSWLLESREDIHGNSMAFSYFRHSHPDGSVEMHPSAISYAAFSGGSHIASHGPSKEVIFHYEDRSDAEVIFVGGLGIRTSKRLARVEMRQIGQEKPVRTYALGYAQSATTGRSLLRWVESCDMFGQCLPKTEFRWTAGTPPDETFASSSVPILDKRHVDREWTADLPLLLGGSTFPPAFAIGDFMGSHADPTALFWNIPNEAYTYTYSQVRVGPTNEANPGEPRTEPVASTLPDRPTYLSGPLVPVDFEGDGIQELLAAYLTEDEQAASLDLLRWDPTLEKFSRERDVARCRVNPSDVPPPLVGPYVGDFDGDGSIDLLVGCARRDAAAVWTRNWEIRFNDGDGVLAEPALVATTAITSDPENPYLARDRAIVQRARDLDMDGRVEVLVRLGSDVHLLGEHGLSETPANVPAEVLTGDVVWLDGNGDGLSDLLYVTGFDGFRYYENVGNGFVDRGDPLEGAYGRWHDDRSPGDFQVSDLNRDGADDFLLFYHRGDDVIAHMSRRDGTFEVHPLGFSPGQPAILGQSRARLWLSTALIDYNRDGADDLFFLASDGSLHRRDSRAGGPEPDLLENVLPGTDPVTFRYETFGHRTWQGTTQITHGSAGECSYPQRCIQAGLTVARRYIEGNRSYEFTYEDGRVDVRGHGFLGFSRVLRTDVSGRNDGWPRINYVEQFFDLRPDSRGNYPAARVPRTEVRTFQVQPDLVQVEVDKQAFEAIELEDGRFITVPTHRDAYLFEREAKGRQDVDELFGGEGTLLRHQSQTYSDFDEWGYAEQVIENDQEGESRGTTRDVQLEFEHRPEHNLIGLPIARTVKSTRDGVSETRVTHFVSDEYGHVDQEIREPDRLAIERGTTAHERSHFYRMTDYERDEYGSVLSVTVSDANGEKRSTLYTYKATDQERLHPTASVNPLGHRTEYRVHPVFGVPTMIVDPNGHRTVRQFDGFGGVVAEHVQDGQSTTYEYARGDAGVWRIEQRRRSDGHFEELRYDQRARLLEHRVLESRGDSTADVWRTTRYRYNSIREQPASRIGPFFDDGSAIADDQLPRITTTYDGIDRPTRVSREPMTYEEIGPDGTPIPISVPEPVTRIEYDGLTRTVTPPTGMASTESLDGEGNLLTVTEGTGDNQTSMRYEYGPSGRVEKIEDEFGSSVVSHYDALGRLVVIDDPNAGKKKQYWNAFDELALVAEADGENVYYERDALGRVTERRDNFGTTTFQYDEASGGFSTGRLTSTTSPDGIRTSMVYRRDGKPVEAAWSIEADVSGSGLAGSVFRFAYHYDSLGRVHIVEYPALFSDIRDAFRFGYDDVGRKNQIEHGHLEQGRLGEEHVWVSLGDVWYARGFDATGHITEEVAGNGLTTQRSYLPGSSLLSSSRTWPETETGPTTPPLLSSAYRYGPDSFTASADTWVDGTSVGEEFEHDAMGRLTRWRLDGDESVLKYDELGNLGSIGDSQFRHQHPNAGPHALHQDQEGNVYKYDLKGRLSSGGSFHSFAYRSFDLPGTIALLSSKHDFAYDAFQSRVVHTRTDAAGTKSSLLTLGGLVEVDLGAKEALLHVHGPEGPVAVVYQKGPHRTPLYLHRDRLGSLQAVTNEEAEVVGAFRYSPFGRRVELRRSGVLTSMKMELRLGFTGHAHDRELGLINMKGRVYSPSLARFITPDPAGAAPTSPRLLNRYDYVMNSPMMLVDPTGFQSEGVGADPWGATFRNPVGPAYEPNQRWLDPNTDLTGACQGTCHNREGTPMTADQFAEALHLGLHLTLDLFGLIPVWGAPFDVVHAALFMVEGQWGEAALVAGTGGLGLAGDLFRLGSVAGRMNRLRLSMTLTDLQPPFAVGPQLATAMPYQLRLSSRLPLGGAFQAASVGVHGQNALEHLFGEGVIDGMRVVDNAEDAERMRRARELGERGQLRLVEMFGGTEQVGFRTSMGMRYVDNLADGVAREAKVGLTDLDKFVEAQFFKDVEILAYSDEVVRVEWHFFPSPNSGVGPTPALRSLLETAGFDIVIHSAL